MSHDIVIHVVRHGHIPSHESDVALTAEGQSAVRETGQQLAAAVDGAETISFLHGPARRARQTAWGIYDGLKAGLRAADDATTSISAPEEHTGLRNLGLMIDGRLQEAMRLFYDQVRRAYRADPTPANADRLEFHDSFWNADDPIGYWLTHPCPYAEDPNRVATRVGAVIEQLLADSSAAPIQRQRVICASHSATVRAFLRRVLGTDPGEPDFCEGFTVDRVGDRPARVTFRDQTKECVVTTSVV